MRKYLLLGIIIVGASILLTRIPLHMDVISQATSTPLPTPTPSLASISMLHFGDIMVGRKVAPSIAAGLNPFEKISAIFRDYDLVLANLEGPITTTTDCQKKEIVFHFVPSTAQLLKSNGFSIVNLANNHGYDCKMTGLADTKRYLKEAGVGFFGTIAGSEDVETRTIDGKTIAFLGADLIDPGDARLKAFLDSITAAKEHHDFVVVHAHWGDEYKPLPNAPQQSIGHQIIDAGADLLIGHHPHVIETAEIYKDRVIFYSLGNFIFDQYMPGTKEGLGVGVVQQDDRAHFVLYPFDIVNYQPQLKPEDKSLETCNFVLKGIAQHDGCFFEVPR